MVPVILNVLETMSSELDNDDKDFEELFCKAIDIADSIQDVRVKLVSGDADANSVVSSVVLLGFHELFSLFWQEGKDRNKLCALLGLYVLQTMVDISCQSEILFSAVFSCA